MYYIIYTDEMAPVPLKGNVPYAQTTPWILLTLIRINHVDVALRAFSEGAVFATEESGITCEDASLRSAYQPMMKTPS
jgi:hypothetical protein